jgi:predicted dehydrogenase
MSPQDAPRRIKVLQFGAGRFGAVHLAEWKTLQAAGRVELAGVVVRTEDSRRAAEQTHGVPAYTQVTDELLDGVDAVDIVTPAATHVELVRRCLPHAHVLVEKPLAETPEDARSLQAQADELGRVLMMAHVYRFHPVMAELQRLVESIPRHPRSIRSVFSNPREPQGSHADPALELLHPFDMIDSLFGLEPEVCVGRQKDGMNHVSLRYPGPITGLVKLGWSGAEKVRTLDLLYPDREIKADFVAKAIHVRTRNNQVDKTHFPGPPGAVAAELDAFVDAVAGTDDSYPGADVGVAMVEVATRSAPSSPPRKPRVGILGGGVFGAVFAIELAKFCDVSLFERHDELMTEVSWANQWRHHSGFHYPRSYDTIQEIKAARGDFEAEYEDAIVRSYPSYFCPSASGLEIPAERYLAACESNELNFTIEKPPANVLDHSSVSLCVRSDEAVYDIPRLKAILLERLEASDSIQVHLGTPVRSASIDGAGGKRLRFGHGDDPQEESFDYLINATYRNLNLLPHWLGFPIEPLRFDLYELLVMRLPIPQICVTIMDGPFTSLVGMGQDDLFMLSHIHQSVLKSVITEDGMPPQWGTVQSNRENMLRQGSKYLPILSEAEVVESRYATRAVNAYARDFDARPTVIREHGFGCWSVLGGKILTSVTNAREIAREILAERRSVDRDGAAAVGDRAGA